MASFFSFFPGIWGNAPKRILSAGRVDSVLAQLSGDAVISLHLGPSGQLPLLLRNFQKQISTCSAGSKLLKVREAIKGEEVQGA